MMELCLMSCVMLCPEMCRLRPCHLAKTHAALSDLASRQRVLLLSSPPPAAGPPEELLALVAAYAQSAHAAAFAPPPLLQLQDVLGPESNSLTEEQVCACLTSNAYPCPGLGDASLGSIICQSVFDIRNLGTGSRSFALCFCILTYPYEKNP
jgi:hypothetical protein